MDTIEKNKWVQGQRNDPSLQRVFEAIEKQEATSYQLIDGLLYKKTNNVDHQLLVVPFSFIETILREYHDNNAHMSRNRLRDILAVRFYWPRMFKHIGDWVNACIRCRKFKPDRPGRHGLLEPIVVTYPFQLLELDIIGPRHISKGRFRYILVGVDNFTNWIEAAALKTLTAEEVICAFFRIIIARHGCPTGVLTDQGTQFTSKLFKDLCAKFNIKHHLTTAYHHQSAGKVERFVRFLTKSISTMLNAAQTNWDEIIDDCLFVYRTSISRVLDDSPFYMLYGRDPILPQDLAIPLRLRQPETDADYKVEQVKRLKIAYENLNRRKEDYQFYYKNVYDKSHREIQFGIGELVMVYFPAQKVGLSYKFLPKWDGPLRSSETK
jgi:transposase InsO family protein